MPWMTISCGHCGHIDDIDQFTRTPISGNLPPGVYQCPHCQRAIQRHVSPGTRYPSGLYIPGPIALVEVDCNRQTDSQRHGLLTKHKPRWPDWPPVKRP